MAKTQVRISVAGDSNQGSSNSSSSTGAPAATAVNGAAAGVNGLKMKRTRKSAPRKSPSQRSSIYRGVTRHRWTGRHEAHLWDKNCWNETQNKKGKQVYLGAYDDEEAAARAYDLAALKYWGCATVLNFPLATYQEELKEMDGQSKEEYIGSLRRKSSGFSRGVSKYRGVARHHHNGRWEARIGRVFGNKYLYLGTYATQEEAATAYDLAAIEYRGLNAVTNFDLSRYIQWLRPDVLDGNPNPAFNAATAGVPLLRPAGAAPVDASSPSIVQGVQLLHSSVIKEIMERDSAAVTAVAAEEAPVVSTPTPAESSDRRPSRCSFPEDIQTFFGCQDGVSSYGGADDDDTIFCGMGAFDHHSLVGFHCELDALQAPQ